jgi:hypothetical protein
VPKTKKLKHPLNKRIALENLRKTIKRKEREFNWI